MVMEKLKVNPAKVHGRYVYHAVKRLYDIIASAIGLIRKRHITEYLF